LRGRRTSDLIGRGDYGHLESNNQVKERGHRALVEYLSTGFTVVLFVRKITKQMSLLYFIHGTGGSPGAEARP
jgi:hypothetical protein